MKQLIAGCVFVATVLVAAQGTIERYAIISGGSESMHGSWDTRDERQLKDLRQKYGSHFAWFRQEGRDFVVTNDGVMNSLTEALAPQREVNRQQGEVNRHQSDVNRMQAEVNRHQGRVNRDQDGVNRRQSAVNRGEATQAEVNRLQDDVNAQQHVVNSEQQKVNEEQSRVNREQGVVNQAQSRANAKIRQAVQQVVESARSRGLAQELP